MSTRDPAAGGADPGTAGSRSGGRLGRDATVAVVVAITLVAAAMGLVSGAALSTEIEPSSPRFAEAQFLPVAEAGTLAADPELAPDERSGSHDISLGGAEETSGAGEILLARHGVPVPLPDGWRLAAGDGESWALLTDDDSTWVTINTTATDPALVSSDAVLRAAFPHTFISDPRVGHLAASDPAPLPPFGRAISRSMLSYTAVYADPMLSARFQANVYAGLRNDGTVLLLEVRLYAGSSWDVASDDWYRSLYAPLWETFGAADLPTADSP